jgi:NADH dehydrogenase/NADH:ubiquinone oxidoreductase subunit G
MPTAVLLNIKESCNSSGAELLNLKALSKNDLLKAEVLVAVNLDDTLLVRRILSQASTKMVMWLNTHGSQLGAKTDYIVPTTTAFEGEGIYLNLENRPQKSLKTLPGINDMRSVSSIFNAIGANYKLSTFLDYIAETVDNSKYFSSVKHLLISSITAKDLKCVSKVSLYPSKPSVEDFFLKGRISKNSLTMLECSQEMRKNMTNF